MPKASRSKKQPAFDANELADLIYSPAVGTGVGSHLLRETHPEGKSPIGGLVRAASVIANLVPFPSTASVDGLPANIQASAQHPEGNLPTGVKKAPSDVTGSTVGSLPIGIGTESARADLSHPECNLPPGVNHSLGNLTSEINHIDTTPMGKLPTGVTISEDLKGEPIGNVSAINYPEGELPIGTTEPLAISEMDANHRDSCPEGELHIGLTASGDIVNTGVTEAITAKSDDNFETRPEGESPTGETGLKGNSATTNDATPLSVEASSGRTKRPQVKRPATSDTSRKQPTVVEATHSQGKLPIGVVGPSSGSQQAAPIEALDGSIVGRQQKIRRAFVAQDGHSSGEQLLYLSLWNAARHETAESRLISIGYNGMSHLCKLERSNCKKNAQSLIEKLALEVIKPHETVSSTGTTYRIFSYGEILRRRKAAGLIWVIRTSGVRFVNPMSESPTPPVGDLPTVSMSEAPTGSVGNSPTPPVCETPTHIGKDRKATEIQSSSAAIYRTLSQFGTVDDDAVRQITASCHSAAPDCTDDEIIHFIRQKGSMVHAGKINNPIGFLLTTVPKCFMGQSFQLYRAEERRRLEEEAEANERAKRQVEEWHLEQQRLLLDPNVPESDKALIRGWLGLSSDDGAAAATKSQGAGN